MALQRGRVRERCRANVVAIQGQRLSYGFGDELTKDGMLGRTCLVCVCSSQGMVVGWRRGRGRGRGRSVRDHLGQVQMGLDSARFNRYKLSIRRGVDV